MKSSKLMTVIVAIVIIAVVAGGGYYAYHYETTGTMKVSAADTPSNITGVMAVDVTFSSIALHNKASSNSTGWTNYSLHDKTVNIMDLNASNAAFLSNISVHAGSYNLMKIYIKNVTIHVDTSILTMFGSNATVTMNLAHAFALVVLVHPVTVSAHATTSIVTDFDLEHDINPSGKTFNMSATVDILS